MSSSIAVAIQLANGIFYLAQAPRLVVASATFKASYPPSTFFFTLELPPPAGELLQ